MSAADMGRHDKPLRWDEEYRAHIYKEIRQFEEYRTRRLVLEVWDRMETEGKLPKPYERGESSTVIIHEQPAAVKPAVAEEPVPSPAMSAPNKRPKVVEENLAQSMLSDFGLYKCEKCGKMVMGYEKENHVKNVHGGGSVAWRRVK